MASQIGYEILVKIVWKLVGNYEKFLKNHKQMVFEAKLLHAQEKELEVTRQLRSIGMHLGVKLEMMHGLRQNSICS